MSSTRDVPNARKRQYLRVALGLVRDAGNDGIAPKELFPKAEIILQPYGVETTPYAADSNVPRLRTIIRFMTIRAVKAGWLVKSSARWYITPEGAEALDTYKSADGLFSAAMKAYKEWKTSTTQSTDSEIVDVIEVPSDDATAFNDGDDLVAARLDSARDTAAEAIRAHLEAMKEYPFQDMIAALLSAMGYHVAWVAPPGPDGGIDMLVYADPLGAQKPRIKVQVKHGSDPVSRNTLEQFFGVLGPSDVGIFVSRRGFTKDASREARHDKIRQVTLLDADELVKLWIKHYASMSEEQKAFMRIEPVYFLAPD